MQQTTWQRVYLFAKRLSSSSSPFYHRHTIVITFAAQTLLQTDDRGDEESTSQTKMQTKYKRRRRSFIVPIFNPLHWTTSYSVSSLVHRRPKFSALAPVLETVFIICRRRLWGGFRLLRYLIIERLLFSIASSASSPNHEIIMFNLQGRRRMRSEESA